MSFETVRHNGVEYLRSTLIDTPHGFSTRYGGVSEGVFASLNLGFHQGDSDENRIENYRRLGEAIGFTPDDVVFNRQAHKTDLRRVTRADCGQAVYLENLMVYDGMVTNEAGPAMAVFGADCPTILYYDPVHHAAAAAHAGWRGTAAGMAGIVVARMAADFGTRPEDLRVAIGPCIGPCCFETHADVPDAVLASMGSFAEPAIKQLPYSDEGGQKYSVDLKLLNEMVLRRAGVEQIDICPVCTSCSSERFWSHRVTKGIRGSQVSVILLR